MDTMPHGPSRDGPFGPPPIQREMTAYDAPPYWSQPPHAARYPPPIPMPPPPSHHGHHHPQHSQHVRSPHRVPPPPDYHHHHGPPQPPLGHYHHSQHQQYGGRQWHDTERHYPPHAPHYHHSSSRRDVPRDDYGRPYIPMQLEYEPPPPSYHGATRQTERSPPPPPVPSTPPIQFRPNSRTDSSNGSSSTKKKSCKNSKDSKKKKKGDALSLLAKVSTAMADPEEEEKKEKAAKEKAEKEAKEETQHKSPPRRTSPVKTWSTPKQQYQDRLSRQITPTSMDQHRSGHPPGPPAYYHQTFPPYPRYGHYPAPPGAPPATSPYYRGGDSPTVISDRGSFEDERVTSYGSPPRHYEDHNHYAPYTYVQQPRMEDKTILRKKFSWKHYPELERFLIANRDEYLRHSALNYTAEQKQYNNWLTERLLEVAARHHYVFDPEDFNFVAVRDRIRCYYKSYVQTARKRGLPLITQKLKSAKAEVE